MCMFPESIFFYPSLVSETVKPYKYVVELNFLAFHLCCLLFLLPPVCKVSDKKLEMLGCSDVWMHCLVCFRYRACKILIHSWDSGHKLSVKLKPSLCSYGSYSGIVKKNLAVDCSLKLTPSWWSICLVSHCVLQELTAVWRLGLWLNHRLTDTTSTLKPC